MSTDASSTLQLVFAGEILEGFSLTEVKLRLAQALKLDDARLRSLFSGQRVVIKRGVDAAAADRWVAQFRAMGARLHIVTAPQAPSAPPPAPPPAAPAPLSLVPQAPNPRDPHAAPVPAPIAANTPMPTEEITCPSCGDRQPKRILCRSCACDMPRGIAAREEEAAAERARRNEESMARRGVRRQESRRSSSTPSSRFAAPRADVRVDEDDAPLLGLSFDGRVGRLRYIFSSFALTVIMLWSCLFVLTKPGGASVSLMVIAFVIVLVLGFRVSVLRLHDMDRSGWWALLLLIPAVNGLTNLALMFVSGTDGDNDHGAPPSPDSWLRVVGSLLALVVTLGAIDKMAGPELGNRWHQQGQTADDEDDSTDAGESSLPPDGMLRGRLQSDAAVAEFHHYIDASPHRAFAVSGAGAWGWHAGATSTERAVEMAISDCDSRREAYTAECYIAHVDDRWALD